MYNEIDCILKIKLLTLKKNKIMKTTTRTTTNQANRFFLLFGMVLFGTGLFAESTFVIKGRIVNSEKLPVNAATTTLLSSVSLEIVANAICDANGVFKIENVKIGEYYLSVYKPGFPKSEVRRIIVRENGTIIDNASIVLSHSKDQKIQSIDNLNKLTTD